MKKALPPLPLLHVAGAYYAPLWSARGGEDGVLRPVRGRDEEGLAPSAIAVHRWRVLGAPQVSSGEGDAAPGRKCGRGRMGSSCALPVSRVIEHHVTHHVMVDLLVVANMHLVVWLSLDL